MHSIYNHCVENRKDFPKVSLFVSWIGAMITLSGSNYPCLERISMVPKMFEPLRFDCKELWVQSVWFCLSAFRFFFDRLITNAVGKTELPLCIAKACLYNFDPLKPHFYIAKLGFTGVYIIIAPLWKSGAILDLPCPSVIPSLRHSVIPWLLNNFYVWDPTSMKHILHLVSNVSKV